VKLGRAHTSTATAAAATDDEEGASSEENAASDAGRGESDTVSVSAPSRAAMAAPVMKAWGGRGE